MAEAIVGGGMDNEEPISPSHSFLPPLYSHELFNLVFLWGWLQQSITRADQDGPVALSISDLFDQFPKLVETDKKIIHRLFCGLSSFAVFGSEGSSRRIFDAIHVDSMNALLNPLALDVASFFGLSSYDSVNASTVTSKLGVVLNVDLFRKLDSFSKRLYVRLLIASSKASLESDFYSVFLDSSDMKIFEEYDDLDRKISAATEFMGQLGYLESVGSGNKFLVSDAGKHSFRLSIEAVPLLPDSLVHYFAKVHFLQKTKEDLLLQCQESSGRVLTQSELDSLMRLTGHWHGDGSESIGGIRGYSDTVIGIPDVFLEWCMRNSPLHSNPLPSEIQNSLFADICYLTHENLIANYEKFAKILRYDEHVRSYIVNEGMSNDQSPLPRHSVSRKVSDKSKVPTVNKTQVAPARPLGESELVPAKEQASTLREEKSEPKLAGKTVPERNKLRMNAVSIATSELRKIKKYNTDEYKKLRQQFIQSLSQVDQKILKDIELKMRRDVFEGQIENRLIRYMASHPEAWSSARMN
jgi:hypothetical protein